MLSSDTDKISKIISGKSSSDKVINFQGICTDTRGQISGKLFIALEGEKFDGVKKDFKADDVMVMISDGLPELPNPTNDLLDYEKIENCIKENAEKSANEIKNALVYLSDDWAKGVMNPDDITIVIIKKAA